MVRQRDFKRGLIRIMLLPIILALALGGVLIVQLDYILAKADRLRATNEAIGRAYETQKLIVDQETGFRGFLLTQDSSFLVPYLAAQRPLSSAFHQLLRLSSSDTLQVYIVDSIRTNYLRWLNLTRRTSDAFDSTTQLRGIQERAPLMKLVRSLFVRYLQSQHQRQAMEERALRSSVTNTIYAILALCSLIGILIATSARSQIRSLTQQYQQSLDVSNRSNTLLETTILSISDAVVVTDSVGNVTIINPVAAHLTGWEVNQAKRKPLRHIFHLVDEQSKEPVESPIEQVIRDRRPSGIRSDVILLSRSGLDYPIEVSASPIISTGQQVIGAVLVFRDITNRKLVERELYRREEEFRALVENSPDPIARLDRDLRFVYTNPVVEDILGIAPKAFISKTFREVGMSQDRYVRWETAVREVFRSGREMVIDMDLQTPHKGLLNFQVQLVPEFNKDGEVETVLSTSRDVTDMRRVLDQLQEGEAKFRAVIDTSLDGFLLLRALRNLGEVIDFQVTYVNDRAAEFTGRPREQLQGRRISELVSEEEREKLVARYAQVLTTSQPSQYELHQEAPYSAVEWTDEQVVKFGEGVAVRIADISFRKNLEESLAARQREFQTLVENSPDVIQRYTPDLRLTYVNPAVSEALGVPPSEIIGKTWEEIGIPPEVTAPWRDAFDRVFKTGESTSFETQLPDGKYGLHYYQVVVVPELDQNNNVVSVLATSRNVTASKGLESQLKENEVLFRTVIENSLDAFYLLRAIRDQSKTIVDFRFEYVNQKGTELTTFDRREMVGSTIHGIMPETRASAYVQKCASIVESAKPLVEEYEILSTQEEAKLWLHSEFYKVGDGVAITTTDITPRKETEDALRKSEERYRKLISDASEAIFSTDLQGHFVFANPFIRMLSGYTPEELYGTNYFDLIPEEHRERVRRHYFRQYLSQTQSSFVEYPFRNKSGEVRWLAQTASLRQDGDEVVGFDLIATDITEKRKFEDELIAAKARIEETDRLKSSMLQNLSHDVRKPLDAILTIAASLETEAEHTAQRQLAKRISESGVRLMTSLNQILDLSSIDSENFALQPRRLLLRTEVDRVAALYAPLAEEKNLRFSVVDAGQEIWVRVDPTAFDQVLSNLVDNSIKYTDSGFVELRLGVEGEGAAQGAVVRVADSGKGIPPELLQSIFGKPAAKSNSQNGSPQNEQAAEGLGLRISLRLMALMGGNIEIEQSDAKGTTFKVVCPVDNGR